MKKYICLTIICISFFQIAFSQTNKVDVIWGPTHENNNNNFIVLFYGGGSGFYAMKKIKKEYSLEHYDNDLKLIKSHSLNKVSYFSPIIDNAIWKIYSEINENKKVNNIFIHRHNKNTFEEIEEAKKVVDLTICEDCYNGSFSNLELSKDTTKILFIYFNPIKKGEKPNIGIKVFNNKMELLWEKEKTKLCEESNLYRIHQKVVDNSGNVHLLLKVYHDERKEEKNNESNYHFTIISYYNNGEERVEYPIVNDKYLENMNMDINDENELICTGFYYDKYKQNRFEDLLGYCYYKIDIDSKCIIIKKNNEFDTYYLEQNNLDKCPFKGKQQLILREDGGVIFINEHYVGGSSTNFSTSTSSGKVTSTSSDAYYYSYIFIIKYAPDGDIEWKNVIFKHQVCEKYEYLPYFSYTTHITEDIIYFLINDHADNFESIKPKEYKRYGIGDMRRNSMVVLYELSMDGKLKKEALFDSDFPFMINTVVSSQITDDEFLIYGSDTESSGGKKKKLGKLSFE